MLSLSLSSSLFRRALHPRCHRSDPPRPSSDLAPADRLASGDTRRRAADRRRGRPRTRPTKATVAGGRSEEHTSELQSLTNLVCRLLLEKKKQNKSRHTTRTTSIYNKQLVVTVG